MSNKTSDKNVANIEDDVKIVKRYLENSAYKESNSDFFKNGGWEIVDLEIPKAMKNILAEREQDKKRIKELEKENVMLKLIRVEYEYGYENIHLCTKNDLVKIDKNKYLIEVKDGKFVDIKQLYIDTLNSISKQKVKEVLQNNRNELFSMTYLSKEQYKPYEMQVERINKIEQELLEGGENEKSN